MYIITVLFKMVAAILFFIFISLICIFSTNKLRKFLWKEYILKFYTYRKQKGAGYEFITLSLFQWIFKDTSYTKPL